MFITDSEKDKIKATNLLEYLKRNNIIITQELMQKLSELQNANIQSE